VSVKPLSKVGMVFVQEGKEKSYKLNHVRNKIKGDIPKEFIKKEKNVDSTDLINMLMEKIDSLGNSTTDIYGEKNLSKKLGAIDVDIERNLLNYKADKSNISVDEERVGKVNNKLDKLRALRKK
jgi:hypothetical protein